MRTAKSHSKSRRLLSLFFALAAMSAHGQFYDSGQDRFMRLSHIKTEHFDVIFPRSEKQLGLLYANNLEQVYKTGGISLGWQPRRVPAVLRTATAYSNGEVVWAPRRMNLMTTASPDNYPQRWDQQLVLHEFRHVVQTDKLNQGASLYLGYLLGEQYTGLLLGLHVPLWFMEGDAVTYETGASSSGRGRTSNFENDLAAQVSQKGIYHYHKAMFGSYADHVPTKYHLGYQLVNYGRMNYGAELWQNCLNRVATHPIALRPFGRAIRNTTGLREPDFYKKALEPLTAPVKVEPENATIITHCNPDNYTNYYYPHNVGGEIVAYRENLSDIAAIVRIDSSGKERIIRHTGLMAVKHLSASGGTLVWNQRRATRWEMFNHSQIITYDLDKHRRRTIVRRGRYHCSTLSKSGQLIASACYTDSARWSIAIHDLKGRLVMRIPTGNAVPVRISWADNDNQLAFIANVDNMKCVLVHNFASHKTDTILKVEDDISDIIIDDKTILFTGNYNGNTAWYNYNVADSSCRIVATSGFGTGSGSMSGDTLLFTFYTADGYMIAKKKITDGQADSALPQTRETEFTRHLSETERQVFFATDTSFTVKRYSRLAHLLNIHSWGPLSVRIDENEIGPGLTFMSQDALSTSFLTAGYQYYFADRIDDYFAEYMYKGFRPIIGVRGDLKYTDLKITDNRGNIRVFESQMRELSAVLQLPFVLHSGAFNTTAQLQTGYQFRQQIIEEKAYRRNQSDTLLQTTSYTAYLQHLRRMSHRDLQPRLGFTLRADYMNYLYGESSDYQASVQGRIYLPGLHANHGISVYGAYQERGRNNLIFNNSVSYPRGFRSTANTKFASLLTSYAMPIWYPDICIANALYIKRLKTTLFFDNAKLYNEGWESLQSAGADVTADFYIFRIPVPIIAGVRYARRITTNNNYFGMLLSMNFSSLF